MAKARVLQQKKPLPATTEKEILHESTGETIPTPDNVPAVRKKSMLVSGASGNLPPAIPELTGAQPTLPPPPGLRGDAKWSLRIYPAPVLSLCLTRPPPSPLPCVLVGACVVFSFLLSLWQILESAALSLKLSRNPGLTRDFGFVSSGEYFISLSLLLILFLLIILCSMLDFL